MAVLNFTKIPTGSILDRVQDALAKVITSHTQALNNGLTFAANFQAEFLTANVTTPVSGWNALTLSPTRIKSPALVFLVGANGSTNTQALPTWTVSNGQIQVTNVTGLNPSTQYALTFLLVGG